MSVNNPADDTYWEVGDLIDQILARAKLVSGDFLEEVDYHCGHILTWFNQRADEYEVRMELADKKEGEA